MGSYTASIKGWNAKAQRNTETILKMATQETLEDAQTPTARGGFLPVDTGNLRNSLISGLNGNFGAPSADSFSLTIASLKAGGVANFAWTAAYARIRHYKPESFGQGGGLWRDRAAAKWLARVARIAREVSKQ